MKEYEREILLERIGREGATVGADIPERIEIQGREVDLREFVFEIKRRGTVPAGERERVETAKRNLRRERRERKQRIEEAFAEVSFAEGEELARAVVGIDRALEALEDLDSQTAIEAEERRQETMDKKRWMQFLQKALGRDEGPRAGGR